MKFGKDRRHVSPDPYNIRKIFNTSDLCQYGPAEEGYSKKLTMLSNSSHIGVDVLDVSLKLFRQVTPAPTELSPIIGKLLDQATSELSFAVGVKRKQILILMGCICRIDFIHLALCGRFRQT